MGLTGFDLSTMANRVFFDSIERVNDSSSRWDPPAIGEGVRHESLNVWVQVTFGGSLPRQGWKIHVSTNTADAQRVLDMTAAVCVQYEVDFKYLRSRALLSALNSKYAHRGSAGKFITVYPRDEEILKSLLVELSSTLKGIEGPYILSDLRWDETSPVFLRYGAFSSLHGVASDGESFLAIEDPDGGLVPDKRGAAFEVPAWVEVPSFISERVAEFARLTHIDLPYKIDKSLHFSNGGGVYLATEESSGQRVVLKEARPLAGLDAANADAVTRLQRERDVMIALEGTGRVPRFLGYHVFWEHHFLVQEYIEGETFGSAALARQPHFWPDASEGDLREYVSWCTETINKIENAVSDVHAAGFVLGDVHPHNVIVRPDGSIVLIDLEAAHSIGDSRTGLMGAAGFGAPGNVTGFDVDAHGLEALKIGQFIPLMSLSQLDQGKVTQLADWAEESYPLPEGYSRRAASRMVALRGGVPSKPAEVNGLRSALWPDGKQGLLTAIEASATTDRNDRLFPNSPVGSAGSGVNLLNGSAGVLYSLHAAGLSIHEEWIEWLIKSTRKQMATLPAGLFNGLHGIATVLDLLGQKDQALRLFERAVERDGLTSLSLLSGLPGAGLSALGFYKRNKDTSYKDVAASTADRIIMILEDDGKQSQKLGYADGARGAALFLLRLYEVVGDPRYLDLAGRLLTDELDQFRAVSNSSESTTDRRVATSFLAGLPGLILPLTEYLKHRDSHDLTAGLESAKSAARVPFGISPGILHGRSGMLYSLVVDGVHKNDTVIAAQVRDLWKYAIPFESGMAFPGDNLLRLSMDLGSGTAGVLLALESAETGTDLLAPILGGKVMPA